MLSLLRSDAAESFHSHLNADIKTPHPNIYVFVQSLIRQQASTYVLSGSLAFTRAPSRTRSQKPAQLLQFFYRLLAASLISSAIFGALDIALRLSTFAEYLLRVFSLCMTDTDDVALLELQVAVLSILHLRFC